MSRSIALTTLTMLLLASAAFAQTPPPGAPPGTTATCGDGTFSASAKKEGACSRHQGIKQWYGAPIKVWANKDSMTYHCPSDQWYGKSANGVYMSESDARAQGYHADHDKACK